MAVGVLEGRRACDARPEGSGECKSAAPVYSSTNSTLTAPYVRFQTIAEDGARVRVQFLLSLAQRYAALSKGLSAREDLSAFGAALQVASSRKGDEHASPHSISSSARASTDGGMVMPSSFAVFRLTMTLNSVGCLTAKSPGAIPFWIWSTNLADRMAIAG